MKGCSTTEENRTIVTDLRIHHGLCDNFLISKILRFNDFEFSFEYEKVKEHI